MANKPKTDLTMEQQATTILMKKCGIIEGSQPTAADEGKFRERFVDPMKDEAVDNIREYLGMQEGGSDTFSAVAIHADV